MVKNSSMRRSLALFAAAYVNPSSLAVTRVDALVVGGHRKNFITRHSFGLEDRPFQHFSSRLISSSLQAELSEVAVAAQAIDAPNENPLVHPIADSDEHAPVPNESLKIDESSPATLLAEIEDGNGGGISHEHHDELNRLLAENNPPPSASTDDKVATIAASAPEHSLHSSIMEDKNQNDYHGDSASSLLTDRGTEEEKCIVETRELSSTNDDSSTLVATASQPAADQNLPQDVSAEDSANSSTETIAYIVPGDTGEVGITEDVSAGSDHLTRSVETIGNDIQLDPEAISSLPPLHEIQEHLSAPYSFYALDTTLMSSGCSSSMGSSSHSHHHFWTGDVQNYKGEVVMSTAVRWTVPLPGEPTVALVDSHEDVLELSLLPQQDDVLLHWAITTLLVDFDGFLSTV